VKNTAKVMFLLFVVVALLLGCLPGPVRSVVDQYHGLITAYQKAQEAAANGTSCLVLAFSEMQNQTTLANNYLVADVEKTKAYRESLASYGKQISDKTGNYQGTNGQPLQPGQLDLGELLKAKALPSDLGLSIQAYVTTFTEAPLAAANAEPVLNAQRIVSEKYNLAFACVKDWNSAVKDYNTERNKIPGDVVGRIAEALKVKELPESLPFFIMQGSTSPQALPTIGFGK
jgi:hypothetical protein